MYYKGTKKECENYNKKVTLGEKYKDSTSVWANVVKNQNGQIFAIFKHDKYTSQMILINDIPNDWYKINKNDK
jgi:uncharacterized protein (DUF1810 family)